MVREMDRETLINVARTSLSTKVDKDMAEVLTEVTPNKIVNIFSTSDIFF